MADTRNRKSARKKPSNAKARARSGKVSSSKAAARKASARKTAARRKTTTKRRVSRSEDIKVISSGNGIVTGVHLGDSYYNMIFGTIIMIAIGLLSVYIATGNTQILMKQAVFGAGGVLAMVFLASNLGTVIYKKFCFLAWAGSLVLIGLLKTGMGINVNGATRWLNVLGMSVQVVEIVKVAVIIMCAYLLSEYHRDMYLLPLLGFVWGAAGIPALLIMKISSDLSSALVILLIAFIMTGIVLRNWLIHLIVGAFGGLVFYVAYIKNALDLYKEVGVAGLKAMAEDGTLSYRVQRILGWIYPNAFQQDFAYQTSQSVHAIGSAGFLGKGLGSTLATENFFAIESDFIIAQVASSFGIIGLICVLALFLFIVYNIIYTASNCRDRLFESLLCTGVATHFLFQNFINFCVATGAFPNTGIPFIFLSNGNTGLLINCWEIGMVLAINKNAAKRLMQKGVVI